jgi:Icc-related predicted phosphoesterase
MLKDWERSDVSRYLDPLCIAPEEGWFSVPVEKENLKHQTIQNDLRELTQDADLSLAIFLFHTPPYDTSLDRAALDGKKYNYVNLDVHVGSIAVRRFIESRQPLLTLHGHIHESARLTRTWKERIGKTFAFSSAHDGSELALVRFDLDHLEAATRELL